MFYIVFTYTQLLSNSVLCPKPVMFRATKLLRIVINNMSPNSGFQQMFTDQKLPTELGYFPETLIYQLELRYQTIPLPVDTFLNQHRQQ